MFSAHPTHLGTHNSGHAFGYSQKSQIAKSGLYGGCGSSIIYPVPSLYPTQRGCYGLAPYDGAAEFQTSEVVGAFF